MGEKLNVSQSKVWNQLWIDFERTFRQKKIFLLQTKHEKSALLESTFIGP